MTHQLLARAVGSVAARINSGKRNFASHKRRLTRSFFRVPPEDILRALSLFGSCNKNYLLVHSSLSGCGHIPGGPATIIECLETWLGGGTLVMPTHSYCYSDRDGKVPIFEVDRTPSKVGAITECFWRQTGVMRSLHPTHSLACFGPGAAEICVGHELCATPCGTGTPYKRLIDRDSAVLMFGATMNAYTLFHTTEDSANAPYLYKAEQDSLSVRDADGSVRPFPMWRQDMTAIRRFEEMDVWLEQRGLLFRCQLGRGELLYLPSAAQVHETVLAQIRNDPWFLIADSERLAVSRQFQSQV